MPTDDTSRVKPSEKPSRQSRRARCLVDALSEESHVLSSEICKALERISRLQPTGRIKAVCSHKRRDCCATMYICPLVPVTEVDRLSEAAPTNAHDVRNARSRRLR